jgi:fatty-acyl-CoA synthase
MPELSLLNGVPQYTLDHYERDFAGRHLLHGVVAYWARNRPDALAIIDVDTGAQYTYRQFDQIATALAIRLVEMGARKGDFFATLLPLLPEHIFLEYACFKIGVIHAPLDIRLKAPDVIRSLELVKARAFAFLGKTPHIDFSAMGKAVQEACPFVEHLIQIAPREEVIQGARSGLEFYHEALAASRNPSAMPGWKEYLRAAAAVKETDGAQAIYTTGSTGLPKPALLSHRNITCQNMCLGGGFNMTDGRRMLVNLPPSHVGCQAEQLMTPLFWGGTAVIMHMFDAAGTLKAIEDHRVEVFGQIPAMYAMQWRLPDFARYDLSSLRMALYGGQVVGRPFLEQLSKMAPTFCTGLGLTEMAGFCTYTPLGRTVDEIVGTVGYDMPVTPLSIRQPMNPDGTAGAELPDGQTGEICFSGPQVFSDYINNKEAYRKTVSREGICYTGDLGFRDARGLHLVGRSKLVIKPKGYQVHPSQIEDHFSQLRDKVAVCGAVGAPHEIFSEGVVLFVETRPGASLTRDELEAHAKGIASYMRPLHYVMLPPGTLPLNRIAKTDYVSLKGRALAEVEALRTQGRWDR